MNKATQVLLDHYSKTDLFDIRAVETYIQWNGDKLEPTFKAIILNCPFCGKAHRHGGWNNIEFFEDELLRKPPCSTEHQQSYYFDFVGVLKPSTNKSDYHNRKYVLSGVKPFDYVKHIVDVQTALLRA